MSLRVQKLAPNVLGVDTVASLSPAQCRALVQAGYQFRGGYLDELTPQEIAGQMSAGLPLLLYTYALEFDPAHTLARLAALGIPAGASVVLDLEGVHAPEGATRSDLEALAADVVLKANNWGRGLSNHAFLPCLYLDGGGLLTSREISQLAVYRYHEGNSNLLDRYEVPAIPARGYAMKQGRPGNTTIAAVPGVAFDVDFHCADLRDDVFSVVVAA